MSDTPRAGFDCDTCGHRHQNEAFAFICIGCPCDETPAAPAVRDAPPPLTAYTLRELWMAGDNGDELVYLKDAADQERDALRTQSAQWEGKAIKAEERLAALPVALLLDLLSDRLAVSAADVFELVNYQKADLTRVSRADLEAARTQLEALKTTEADVTKADVTYGHSCGACGRVFHVNRCPDCAQTSQDERAESFKQDAAAWREQAVKAKVILDSLPVDLLLGALEGWLKCDEQAEHFFFRRVGLVPRADLEAARRQLDALKTGNQPAQQAPLRVSCPCGRSYEVRSDSSGLSISET